MRRWGKWVLDNQKLIHQRTGGVVALSQVRSLAEIPQAMEVAYNLHAIGPMDLIHLAAALIEIVGERQL